MKILKGYVMQPAHPEGSIAERYLSDECMHFCASLLNQTDGVGSTIGRNEDIGSAVILEGHPLNRPEHITLNEKDLANVHRYVLFNLAITEPYLE